MLWLLLSRRAPPGLSAWSNAGGNFFIDLASSPKHLHRHLKARANLSTPVTSHTTVFFQVGELLDGAKLPETPLVVDFTVCGPAAVINHNPDGKLVITK
ncbi:hypothetical protein CDV36_000039 [Fusarium kuroshium]|uniref:Uncharacterized protein n=1 Tax=Fusarium kuroshium TaxID=2010991 RepID=A0A3M2SS92_9HYPO|nr:hypothetical protein CDV36_000039 [Fusarium kuroshium]